MALWNHLIKWQEDVVKKLNLASSPVNEPGMDRFNQLNWINLVWKNDWAGHRAA